MHSRKMNIQIKRTHERALRIVSKDQTSTFQELLNKDTTLLKLIHQIYRFWLLKCLKLKLNSTTITGKDVSNCKSKLKLKK